LIYRVFAQDTYSASIQIGERAAFEWDYILDDPLVLGVIRLPAHAKVH